ncbi:GntR family transcriptional regulator [Microvirga antarctica]|uniref:GntR family transcriptional regulator n=1 Tax=Microvirga antarctica TaxID=2819233 RepID=UPI001B300D51|nr:GntR family transcriptional regulator [Microvirga antarctica]
MKKPSYRGAGSMPPAPVFLTKSDLARQHIQEMVISGAVRAGDRITTRQVSEEIGISETPIREAMRSLSAEGWLDSHAHLGVVVASIKSEQVEEVYAIRGALGALAVRLGGLSFTEQRLAEIDRNLADSEEAVSALDFSAYARLNRAFHTFLTDTPYTQWILKLLSNLTAQTSAFHRGFNAVPDRLRGSLDEHHAIRKALGEGDFDRAAAIIVEHERTAGSALVAELTMKKSA